MLKLMYGGSTSEFISLSPWPCTVFGGIDMHIGEHQHHCWLNYMWHTDSELYHFWHWTVSSINKLECTFMLILTLRCNIFSLKWMCARYKWMRKKSNLKGKSVDPSWLLKSESIIGLNLSASLRLHDPIIKKLFFSQSLWTRVDNLLLLWIIVNYHP